MNNGQRKQWVANHMQALDEARLIAGDIPRRHTQKPPVHPLKLTKQQLRVAIMIAHGYPNKAMAIITVRRKPNLDIKDGTDGISIKTIEKHRQELSKVLDLHSIAEVTHWCLYWDLIPNLFNLKDQSWSEENDTVRNTDSSQSNPSTEPKAEAGL